MTKIEAALAELEAKSPLLANIATRLGLVRDDNGVGVASSTIFTNGEAIFWNGSFVDDASPEIVTVAVAYCCLSLLFQHGERRGDRRPYEWQEASSSLIMQMLEDMGFTIPDSCYRPIEVDAQTDTIEEVYERLISRRGTDHLLPEDLDAIRDEVLDRVIAAAQGEENLLTDAETIKEVENRVNHESNWGKVFGLLTDEEVEQFKAGRTL